ncbi:hypothetical protein PIB30_087987 [Stylosanthes scabra]|uniref:Uncharacterized protein n=1 Tax=Stylosanthes scabra TaxID=79078 RepID=A0ABU6QU33_9FABA|nr:hypothetical protein [Stylosanthes scabra]
MGIMKKIKRKLGKHEKRKTELQGKGSLGVAEPQGLFGLIQHLTPRCDARRLGMDEAARNKTLHQGLNA